MEEKKDNKKSKYIITITGSNTDFVFPINTISDFKNLEQVLKTIKKKLKHS